MRTGCGFPRTYRINYRYAEARRLARTRSGADGRTHGREGIVNESIKARCVRGPGSRSPYAAVRLRTVAPNRFLFPIPTTPLYLEFRVGLVSTFRLLFLSLSRFAPNRRAACPSLPCNLNKCDRAISFPVVPYCWVINRTGIDVITRIAVSPSGY